MSYYVTIAVAVYSQVPNTSNVTIIYNLAKGTPLRPY